MNTNVAYELARTKELLDYVVWLHQRPVPNTDDGYDGPEYQ